MDPFVPRVRVIPAYRKVSKTHLFSWVTWAFPVEESGTRPRASSGMTLLLPAQRSSRTCITAPSELWPRQEGRHLPIQGCKAFFLCILISLGFCCIERPVGAKKQLPLPLTGGIAWPSWEAAAAGSWSLPSSAVAPDFRAENRTPTLSHAPCWTRSRAHCSVEKRPRNTASSIFLCRFYTLLITSDQWLWEN